MDNYEWMREKSSPDVICHLEAENAYTEEQTAHLAPLSQHIYDEIKDRTRETDLSVPVREGAWWYYSRSIEGKQYGVHCRAPISDPDVWEPPRPGDESPVPGEEVLLDGNLEAQGHDFFSIGSFDVSTDGTLLAWAVDTIGDERYTLRVKKLDELDGRDAAVETNEIDVIPNTFHGAIFSPDGRYVFYTTVDESWRPDTLWRHTVGTDADEDVAVFQEPDERFWVGIDLTRSKQYLLVYVSSKITSEVHLLDAAHPAGKFRVIWPRREGVDYSVEHAVIDGSDRLLILHNDGAENFELVDVPADDPNSVEDRITLIPHRFDIRLESVEAFEKFLVAEYRREGLTRLAVVPVSAVRTADARVNGGVDLPAHELTFDEPLFTVGAGGNPEWTQPTVRFGYTSLIEQQSVYDHVVATGERRLLKQQPVLGNFDPDQYAQTRVWAIATDDTRVPVSLVWKRDVHHESDLLTGRTPKPLVLYGYGSYESSMDPVFSIPRLSLLDRGVVFAVAHVRGGGEMGRFWYENGKTLTKKNTFTDFVDVATHLIDAGYTTPDQLVAQGGSAGGLLMGAVANLAPEKFTGIIAQVPFVDALTSILDPELPLTVIEWDEWGDPLHDAQVYAYMKSYSPYENVRSDVAYPRILAMTSLNDTRVLYVEPAKWVARLREVGAPVLLKTEMSAGHGGVSGRYDRWKEIAFEYAWLLDVLDASSYSGEMGRDEQSADGHPETGKSGEDPDDNVPSYDELPGTQDSPLAQPLSVVEGSIPGVQSHLPGQESANKSAAGQVADGDAIDTLGDGELPGENRKSSGETLGDDDDHPGEKEAEAPPLRSGDI